MAFRPNPLLAAVAAPPIAEAQGWIKGRTFAPDRPLIDLAQAVPGYPPAAELTAHLAGVVGAAEVARYTAIEGLDELRAALAADIAGVYGAPVGLFGVTRTMARVREVIRAAASAGSGTPLRSGRNGRCTGRTPSISSHIW